MSSGARVPTCFEPFASNDLRDHVGSFDDTFFSFAATVVKVVHTVIKI